MDKLLLSDNFINELLTICVKNKPVEKNIITENFMAIFIVLLITILIVFVYNTNKFK